MTNKEKALHYIESVKKGIGHPTAGVYEVAISVSDAKEAIEIAVQPYDASEIYNNLQRISFQSSPKGLQAFGGIGVLEDLAEKGIIKLTE